MKRFFVFVFGVTSYVIGLGVFVYLAGFLGNLYVPRSIDTLPKDPLWLAMVIDTLLLGIFAIQHSVMARPRFKEVLTRVVPKPAERSVYVLFSNFALMLLFWQWRPIGGMIWEIQDPFGRSIVHGIYGLGWLMVLGTTFLINHFDLFGLRQVWIYLLGKQYSPLRFKTPGPYKFVRHPLYVGWLIVFWSTPTMTIAHLVFAFSMTLYILVAIRFEERDLVEHHGKAYAEYCRTVPMLIPLAKSRTNNNSHDVDLHATFASEVGHHKGASTAAQNPWEHEPTF